jgi:hypothetical protein
VICVSVQDSAVPKPKFEYHSCVIVIH